MIDRYRYVLYNIGGRKGSFNRYSIGVVINLGVNSLSWLCRIILKIYNSLKGLKYNRFDNFKKSSSGLFKSSAAIAP